MIIYNIIMCPYVIPQPRYIPLVYDVIVLLIYSIGEHCIKVGVVMSKSSDDVILTNVFYWSNETILLNILILLLGNEHWSLLQVMSDSENHYSIIIKNYNNI